MAEQRIMQTDKTIAELPDNTRQIVIEALEFLIDKAPSPEQANRARAALLAVKVTQGELPF